MMKATMCFITVLFASTWDEGTSCTLSSGPHVPVSERPRPGVPTFSQLRSHYARYSSIDFDGLVQQEGLSTWLYGVTDKNTCAVRVSRALTHAGKRIAPGCCDWAGATDRQGRPYLIHVSTMRCYLDNHYGPADITGSSQSNFKGRQGIIVFQSCGFTAATGHVDLWTGGSCVGNCPGAYFSACTNIRLYEF